METRLRIPRTLLLLLLAVALVAAACGSDSTDTSDADPAPATPDEDDAAPGEDANAATATPSTSSDYLGSYTLADDEFGTMTTVTVDGDTRTIVTNALPDHDTGEFPNDGNPNAITEQDLTYTFSAEPAWSGTATFAQNPGVAVNGVSFEPGTGESVTCSSGETYRIEALQDTYNLGLDFNNAHVQPGGKYHYHGVSQLLVEAYEADEDLVHVGFAADGYLVYYSKSAAYDSSYVLSTTERSGTDCIATGPDGVTFDIEGTTPDGTYDTDWVYEEGAGELDECNGVTVDGEYVYIITDEYPFIGRCLMGEFDGAGGGGGGGAAPTDGPDLSEAAAALGVTEEELNNALGGFPPDLDAAAETLGVTVAELEAALPTPPN